MVELHSLQQKGILTALIKQDVDTFEYGYQQHKHPSYPNEEIAKCIKKKLLTLAASQVFTSTATITSDVLQEDHPDNPGPSLLAPAILATAANQHQRVF